MTSKDVEVGQRLAAARLQRGLSQKAVALRASIAPSYLSRIETGKVHPTFRMALQIVKAINASIDELADPDLLAHRARGACPVSSSGRCLLDLIHSELSTSPTSNETYTPRQIQLLRRFAAWVQHAKPDRLRAMEILVEDLRGNAD